MKLNSSNFDAISLENTSFTFIKFSNCDGVRELGAEEDIWS
jgi:hypothetical protein